MIFFNNIFKIAANFINAQLFCNCTFSVSVTVRKIIDHGRTDGRTDGHTDGHTDTVDHRGSVDPKN